MADKKTQSTNTKKQPFSKNKKILTSVIICVSILALVFCGYCVTRLTYNKVYKGVFINDVKMGKGVGSNKRESEEMAANQAINNLKQV